MVDFGLQTSPVLGSGKTRLKGSASMAGVSGQVFIEK